MRIDDPWYEALAAGRAEHRGPPATTTATVGSEDAPAPAPARTVQRRPEPCAARGDVYLTVQRSAAFQQVRRRYRRFALPATAAFLVWYLAYVVLATSAPGLMARPVAGVLNVAMVAGLAQFATTFLLTWAYVRHARLRRDRLALELRWETQDMTRVAMAAQARASSVSGTASESVGGVVGGAAREEAAG